MSKLFTLYTYSTPNGIKISIALEELGLSYKVYKIDFNKTEQKEPWFLKINPNGRIPALVDHSQNDFAVFESGAILLYLAEHYDPNHILLPTDANEKSKTIQWLMFQMGGIGPMFGQAHHFIRYCAEDVPYGKNRYLTETNRLLSVIESQLEDGKPYIIGDQYTLADISMIGWVWGVSMLGIDLKTDFPSVGKWVERVLARPAVDRGVDVPERHKLKDGVDAVNKDLSAARKWIHDGLKAEAEQLQVNASK